jgi:hypothetical protein
MLKMFRTKSVKITGDGESSIISRFIILLSKYYVHDQIKKDELGDMSACVCVCLRLMCVCMCVYIYICVYMLIGEIINTYRILV